MFDLDHTLLAGDSDVLWGEFLAEKGLVDPSAHAAENQFYFSEYQHGRLDIHTFLRFQLRILSQYPLATLQAWREEFMQNKIAPVILPKAVTLVDSHRTRGDVLMIVTATNRFITAPAAEKFGVAHLIATEPEMVNGVYTGAATGTPSFAAGKVTRVQEWLATHAQQYGVSLADSYFYSDSRNDIPLLSLVTHAVAVDADDVLRAEAARRKWPQISLRD